MIIITGASSGLGKEIAKIYKESGKTVINISRRECEYADINICLSLREGGQIKEVADNILKMSEPIEGIINAIGVLSNEHFGEITENEIKRLMSTNVKAPMLLVSYLFERIQRDETDILNIISRSGTQGRPDHPVYSASKWAERGYTKSLQEKLKGTNSRVISFCPGRIDTKFFEKAGTKIDTSNYMQPKDLAIFVKQIIDLPKNIEVSEIILK